MNETGISVQSSMIKTGYEHDRRMTSIQNSGVSGSRNQPISSYNGVNNDDRVSVTGTSQAIGGVDSISAQERYSQATTQVKDAEYYQRKKRAEEFHTRGYEARKKGDYDSAI